MFMKYIWEYKTPEGFDDLVVSGDGETLSGLWFKGSRGAERLRGETVGSRESPAFRETCRWLDEYFAGREPDFTPPYRIDGLTPFRSDVIDAMLKIPFGKTVTYGEIAAGIARKRGLKRMSAQAVGGAVGWNPICIIIPCHRVVGANGALVGYGGGINNKIALLKNEMNAQMMFTRTEDKCCQPPSLKLRRSGCENVASLTTKALNAAAVTNANSQFAYAKATADKLEIGNIGIGNTSTMATFTKMFTGRCGRDRER